MYIQYWPNEHCNLMQLTVSNGVVLININNSYIPLFFIPIEVFSLILSRSTLKPKTQLDIPTKVGLLILTIAACNNKNTSTQRSKESVKQHKILLSYRLQYYGNSTCQLLVTLHEFLWRSVVSILRWGLSLLGRLLKPVGYFTSFSFFPCKRSKGMVKKSLWTHRLDHAYQ